MADGATPKSLMKLIKLTKLATELFLLHSPYICTEEQQRCWCRSREGLDTPSARRGITAIFAVPMDDSRDTSPER